MIPRDILDRIQAEVVGQDPESSHIAADAIWEAALRAIADGVADPARVAKAALTTLEVAPERWYS